MKKIISLAVMAIVIAGASPLLAQTVDVSGTWEITLDMDGQSIVKTCTIVQTGEKIVVTRKKGDEEIKAEGTVKGNKVEWTEIGNVNGQEMNIVYTGTVEGNTMSGEMDFGGNASFEWKAVKKS
jgi:hypothetical protein